VETVKINRLQFFPITLFATVMGITGLGIAFDRFDHITGAATGAGKYIIYSMLVWFCFLSVVYMLKFIKYPEEVKAEFSHPIRINFFPAVSISMLLLSTGLHGYDIGLSKIFCYAGSALHLVFTYIIINIWFYKDFKLQTINPAWFIPVVGTILVPVAGAGHMHNDILWFFFSIGVVLWPILYALIKYRLIFHEQLPAKFLPTKFILIAPPAVGFIAYFKMTGGVDNFSRILYFFALFTTLMLFTMFRRFYSVPYFVSWWAYTFPMDAITIATLVMYKVTGLVFYKYLGTFFLIAATLVIAHVLFYSIVNALRGKICVPE
jgi:tellurite resistance protein